MKFFLFAILFTTNLLAHDICTFEETSDFFDAVQVRPYKVTKKNYSDVEQALIHHTVNLETWRGQMSLEEAMDEFRDLHNGKEGSLAGDIRYFNIGGKKIVIVRYFPGDNEYGAFYEVIDGKYTLIAEIGDSFISCK